MFMRLRPERQARRLPAPAGHELLTLLHARAYAQNLLLAATALDLAAVPLGGFFDHLLDRALGLDGVDRSSLYVVCVGSPGDEA